MRLTAIILLSACITASAKGHTQGITIQEKNISLEKLFKEVRKQTGYVFFYDANVIANSRTVSINVKNGSIEEVLTQSLKGQSLEYSIENKTITIIKKQVSPNEDPDSYRDNLRNEPPPPIDITGKVTDANGNPLVGATVKVKGSNKGTTTDNDGVFVLRGVDADATLEISYVGYEALSIAINNKTSIVTSLKLKPQDMNEVIINKGYYTERQKYSVANVGKVTSKDIEKQPVTNPLLALEGRVPGLQVTQTSGMPGAGVVIRIQGQNSLFNGNNPLYVVDGVPIVTEIPTGYPFAPFPNSGESNIKQTVSGQGNVLNYISPNDIESIEILKDADATSIYGSRAANGAILITTKKGKSGKTSLNADIQQGFSKVGHFMKLLNTKQYLMMRHEAFNNDGRTPTGSDYDINGVWDTTRYTDWQKELLGKTSHYTNANVGISGGNSGMQYLLSGGYHRETSIFPGDFSDEHGSFLANIGNNDANQKFHFQFSATYTLDNNSLPASDLTQTAVLLAPDAPSLYLPDGSLNWYLDANGNSRFQNPLGKLLYQTYTSKTNNLISSAILSYEILKGLKLSSNLGYSNLTQTDNQRKSLLAERPENRQYLLNEAWYGNAKFNTWIAEPQLSYNRSIGNGKFDGLIGTTFQSTVKESNVTAGAGYPTDQTMVNPLAASYFFAEGYLNSLYKYNAVFSRVNYTYNEKYILNLTARRDGSTRFGQSSKFHNFWSVGGAWVFSQESFFKEHGAFISFGKLRANYGTVGSDQIGDYRFLTLYSVVNPNQGVPYQGNTGLAPGDIPNPYLQWEETKKLSAGLDLGFFNNRIFLSGSFSLNKSSNQLINYLLPAVTGRTSVLANFPATIQNKNLEFSLATENLKMRNFKWESNFNLTIPRNKLTSFPNLATSTYSDAYVIGEPISLIKLYSFSGVDPATGIYTVNDSHGIPTASPNFQTDRTVLLTQFQKFYGGLQNSFTFKGFQLDFLFQFVKQIAPSPEFGLALVPGFFNIVGSGNQPIEVLNRWQKPGDNSSIQKFTSRTNTPANTAYSTLKSSDEYYKDASYIRLKNASLSWELPTPWKQKMHLQNLRLYVQGQNLYTITKYKGLDPETLSVSIMPPLRVLTFGIQAKL